MNDSFTPAERSILAVSCYGHFISHFNMLVFPAVLLPLAAQLHLTMTETLNLSFFMYFLFGVSAFPWGFAADRLGARTLLIVFYIGAGICAIITALNVENPLLFSISLAGIGLFSGIYHPAGLGWIAKEIKNTSRAMAFNGIFGNLGLAMAPLVAGFVYYYSGIRVLYFVVAVMNFFGLFLIFLTRNHKRGELEIRGQNQPSSASWTPFLILLLAMTLGGIAYRGTSVTLPAYFELKSSGLFNTLSGVIGDIGSANLTATILTSIIYVVGMGGQYFGGRIGEKYDLRISYLVFHAITIPAAIGMSLSTDMSLFWLAMIHSFFLLGMQPIENTLVARLTPPRLLSSAYGMKFILTFGVGALSVKFIEFVKTEWGIESIFMFIGLVSTFLCCVVVFLIKKTQPIKAET